MQDRLSSGGLNKTGSCKHILTSNKAWVLPISSQDPMAHKEWQLRLRKKGLFVGFIGHKGH